jgi:hypothetical protein
MGRHQVPLEHLALGATAQADEMIGLHRGLDRHGGLGAGTMGSTGLPSAETAAKVEAIRAGTSPGKMGLCATKAVTMAAV